MLAGGSEVQAPAVREMVVKSDFGIYRSEERKKRKKGGRRHYQPDGGLRYCKGGKFFTLRRISRIEEERRKPIE